MTELTVSQVGEDERPTALDTLVLAFAADPVERWLYPQPESYLGSFPRFLVAFGGRAFFDARDLTFAVQTAEEDSHTSYVLGYYAADDVLDG